MNDETLLKTVKNGLMVAGHEMGPVGDHWPAIHVLIEGVEKEFERADRDAAVVGELEFQTADALRHIEEAAQNATPEMKIKIRRFADEMWQRYYAIFEPMDAKHQPNLEDLLGEDISAVKHTRAALNILEGMGGRA